MPVHIYFLLAAIMLFTSVTASAEVSISGESRTYVLTRETADSRKLVNIYEYLNLSADHIITDDTDFHVGGWFRASAADKDSVGGSTSADELDHAYLALRSQTGNGAIYAGRVFVNEGVMAGRIDGVYGRTDLAGGLSASVFGGGAVKSGDYNSSSATAYGGRLAHATGGLYALGLSYLAESGGSASEREEAGIDLRLRPWSKAELSGLSGYNNKLAEWMRHSWHFTTGPYAGTRLLADYEAVDYGAYMTGATTGVFRQAAGIVDPNEKMAMRGAAIEFTPAEGLTVTADYRNYSYDIKDDANRYGGTIAWAKPESGGAGVSIHRMESKGDDTGYEEARAYAFTRTEKASLSADVSASRYDREINGVDTGWTAAVSGAWNVAASGRLGASVEYASTPEFKSEVKGLINYIYRFAAAFGEANGN
ncbi:MAG: hypothetical protein HZA20_00355 [Nitrospirae bacterium]|nr:hypothetical protein [Nitrospirota bacterium]